MASGNMAVCQNQDADSVSQAVWAQASDLLIISISLILIMYMMYMNTFLPTQILSTVQSSGTQ